MRLAEETLGASRATGWVWEAARGNLSKEQKAFIHSTWDFNFMEEVREEEEEEEEEAVVAEEEEEEEEEEKRKKKEEEE
nr:uncharacterized protein LOC129525154 [Gorilla gorilla gorilla]